MSARVALLATALVTAAAPTRAAEPQATGAKERSFLYAAVPGIRNYVEFGGMGLLVFDREDGYKFVKRIPTWAVEAGAPPENVKGIAASARDGRVYIIPAGVPHGWTDITDHVDYLSVRPDPDRVLPKDYVNPAIKK